VKNFLIVFIDGLQYDEAITELSFINKENSVPVTPGIGFSNNIYPEILCGLTPDDIGYFNEWYPVENVGNKTMLYKVLPILDIFRKNIYTNAGIRKLILTKVFKLNFANIPFKYAYYFKPQGSHNFRDLPCNSLLKKYKFHIYDSTEENKKIGFRDKAIVEKLLQDMKHNQSYFLALVDLDNISHIYGVDSREYSNHLSFINNVLQKIFDRFVGLDDSNEIYLFSDHGMANVINIIDFDIEKYFGAMDFKRYLYFLDSTYLRVWIKDKSMYRPMYEYLSNLHFGTLLTNDVREKFGVTNKKFGDFIFRANEGFMFVPNFFGGRPLKAMHGYDSYLKSQKAVFASILGKKPGMTMLSREIHKFLSEILSQK